MCIRLLLTSLKIPRRIGVSEKEGWPQQKGPWSSVLASELQMWAGKTKQGPI